MEEQTNENNIKKQSTEDGTSEKAWKVKAEEYLNGWKRAKADYANFKKETEAKQKEMVQFANALFISELLPIIDNFSSGLTQARKHMKDEAHEWITGFGHISKQFDDVLEKRGIKKIESVGKPFDPTIHEAVKKQKDSSKEEGTVLQEIHTGYTLHGKVLRPAKVIVAE